jgi:hypothetical protein
MVCGAFASTAAANHSWNGYHWARTSNPFTLKVGDNVSSAWDGILNTTLSDWSRSTVLDLTKVAGQATGRCKGTTGRVEVCNGTYGNNGWLGVASISVSGGSKHITLGTVKVNDTYFNTSAYNTTAWRNLVSCQEVGHTLGLDHQDENFYNANLGTCMDYTANPGTNQHPNSHDYAELGTIYAHLDATTTVGLAAKRNAKPSSVKRSDRIVDSTIVWTFADGSKRITHVFWAIGSPRDHLPA